MPDDKKGSFELVSPYQPTGDQPKAIEALVQGVENGEPAQTLLGVTGSGKTFTIANVIEEINRPTLVLSHNKTLAAQLYGELKQFFPQNAVEYFVSYYDYYQPEAYIPTTGLYIEKDSSINDELEKLRLSTSTSLLVGRKDVVVVASVSCIYGIGNPGEFRNNVLTLSIGDGMGRDRFLSDLVDMLYSRSETAFRRGNFRVKGDIVDVFLAYADYAYRFYFFADEVEAIHTIHPQSGHKQREEEEVTIFPANLFITSKEVLDQVIEEIEVDLEKRLNFFERLGQMDEAKRLEERTRLDIDMMKEIGHCPGIENYSRYFDRRGAGTRPFCLIDYFPNDFLLVIDESHVTIPQIRAMWGGDHARKKNLVEYGFRLPAAMDNRPLSFDEFERLVNQVIYVSATPANYEIEQSQGVIVEQIIRPTGLLDPLIEVRPSLNQIDDLLSEIDDRVNKGDRVLVTTLTKRMAEELTKYFEKAGVKCQYIHSEVKTLDRVEILRNLRLGVIDVLIGVNLLREGLDLPEVSLVAILDADKEGFLRNVRSLVQTIGRAARNQEGKVILYADTMTEAMNIAISETQRRRNIQMAYNEKHGITPTSVHKSKEAIMEQTGVVDVVKDKETGAQYFAGESSPSIADDPVINHMEISDLQKIAKETEKKMYKASAALDFKEAARLKKELEDLQKMIHAKR